jgi:radical SAM protein with 4Fe4S-binding SPASM domain
VTLTGGEPFAHPSIINITSAFIQAGVKVTICTNGTFADERQIRMLSDLKDVSINVSLDGFSKNSHGKFRGNTHSFKESYDGIKLFARFGILKGILVTPNNLIELDEYVSLCEFAIQCNAQYVLMNPLSLFGRGVGSKAKLAPAKEVMNAIKATTEVFSNKTDLVNIRFPNKELPLASCEAGNIIYVFVDGALTICPYLVFAAQNSFSQHRPEEFIVGNIFSDDGIDIKLDNYNFNKRYKVGTNGTCGTCDMNSKCGKGCPAAIIAQGQRIGDVDYEQCPKFY